MKALPVRWTSKADQEFFELIMRVQRKWGDLSAQNLAAQIKASENIIAVYPSIFQISDTRPKTRRCVVTPQTSLHYMIMPGEIIIVSVFDNRQDPASLLQ